MALLDFSLPACRTVRGKLSVVLRGQFCGDLLQQLQESNVHLFFSQYVHSQIDEGKRGKMIGMIIFEMSVFITELVVGNYILRKLIRLILL